MDLFTLQELADITNGQLFSEDPLEQIQQIITDSRSSFSSKSLFVALHGERFNGHDFIHDSKEKATAFLIDQANYITKDKSFILVNDTLMAIHAIAKHQRESSSIPIIGITGSNGKTIVKEWLFQLLSPNYYIVKSPKSYNSQVGVPLSVLQLNDQHELGIFEAGISKPNEMEKLNEIIQPTIGVLTNIRSAHDEGFLNRKEKLIEKIKLFKQSDVIVIEEDNSIIEQIKRTYPFKTIISWNKETLGIKLPLKPDPFFKDNIGHCITIMRYLGISDSEIEFRIQQLETLPMRLEIANGKWNTILLNDSYSNDLFGLEIVLDHAGKIAPQKQLALCLGQFEESGLENDQLCEKIKNLILDQKVDFLLLFGAFYVKNMGFFKKITKNTYFFDNTNSAITGVNWKSLANKLVVFKGARNDRLETLVKHLSEKNHDTIWEVNLSALIENLNLFKSKLQNGVKLLVMVKATAYGTEANKIAQILQHQRVDYLGVAYPEEGMALRNEGITTPILVMNTSSAHFKTAVSHQLDIQIYSLDHFQEFIEYAKQHGLINYPIHLKLETGMNRLGFEKEDINQLITMLTDHSELIEVKGILSHLAVADDLKEQQYTKSQIQKFEKMIAHLLPLFKNKPILHILNTSGLVYDKNPQFDMVRLGIGLHGITMNEKLNNQLQQVGRLIATISQIKELEVGDTVGYGRRFSAKHPTTIATISIGYADGYDRRLGNGVGEVLLHGKRAKTVGSICMDMCMIDITDIPDAKVGDEVILTDHRLPITELANRIGTIPYELLTSISTRVQRKFVYE